MNEDEPEPTSPASTAPVNEGRENAVTSTPATQERKVAEPATGETSALGENAVMARIKAKRGRLWKKTVIHLPPPLQSKEKVANVAAMSKTKPSPRVENRSRWRRTVPDQITPGSAAPKTNREHDAMSAEECAAKPTAGPSASHGKDSASSSTLGGKWFCWVVSA